MWKLICINLSLKTGFLMLPYSAMVSLDSSGVQCRNSLPTLICVNN